jgi:hypothetical protein
MIALPPELSHGLQPIACLNVLTIVSNPHYKVQLRKTVTMVTSPRTLEAFALVTFLAQGLHPGTCCAKNRAKESARGARIGPSSFAKMKEKLGSFPILNLGAAIVGTSDCSDSVTNSVSRKRMGALC